MRNTTDGSDKEWYHCSDGDVSKMNDRPKKRAKSDSSGEDTETKDRFSRDAYMLVYKRSTLANVALRSAPERILAAIEADNVAVEGEISDRDYTKASLGDEFDHLAAMKREVLRLLPGVSCCTESQADARMTVSFRQRH